MFGYFTDFHGCLHWYLLYWICLIVTLIYLGYHTAFTLIITLISWLFLLTFQMVAVLNLSWLLHLFTGCNMPKTHEQCIFTWPRFCAQKTYNVILTTYIFVPDFLMIQEKDLIELVTDALRIALPCISPVQWLHFIFKKYFFR